MATYVTQTDLENRLSAAVVKQILDDNVDGTVDAGPLARLLADAEGYVEGFLRGVYDLTALRALTTSAPNEVKRLVLDVAEWMCAKRFPRYIDAEWKEKHAFTRAELMDLRKGVTRLDVVGVPEPAANQGGVVESGNPDDTELLPKFFVDGLGDF